MRAAWYEVPQRPIRPGVDRDHRHSRDRAATASSAEKLVRQSLLAYVTQQERLARNDIVDLADRYGVSTAEALRHEIESGAVYSHPAWEDSIEWENLEAYLARLSELRAQLGPDV